jgi:hypothetical protein
MTDAGDRQISPPDTAVLGEHAAARPLMAGYDSVPGGHAGRWWPVPAGAAPQVPYGLASPPRHQVVGELVDRLALAAAALARVAARGGQDGPR